MTDAQAARIVAEIGIPPCPAVLTAMLRESRKDDPDFASIGTLIASDLGLAAALLKTVNSPFFGLVTRATSVQQALTFLGLRNVVRLVTGLLLKQAFPVSRGEEVSQHWEASSRFAAGTARLARELRCADRDEAYTFGLFRDCGMLLLSGKYADYAGLLRESGFSHGDALARTERERYVTDHARVGFHMATNWFLAEELALAVRHHHDRAFLATVSDGPARRAQALVALGMLIDAMLAANAPGSAARLDSAALEPALERLGISVDHAESLAGGVIEACAAHDAERQS
ncbi:MAG: HDOD domain-containing protein [Betaproteobacteria bacterium]|nr:HDOD domain-containing protein [Betaproteobacteria bacterium]